jgi:hypothetical protein
MLIAVGPWRDRARIAQDLAAYLDQFGGAVAGWLSERLAVGKGHDGPSWFDRGSPMMLRSGFGPMVNIAHFSK